MKLTSLYNLIQNLFAPASHKTKLTPGSMFTLEERTPASIRHAQEMAPHFASSALRRTYVANAIKQLKHDNVSYLFQKRYNSVLSINDVTLNHDLDTGSINNITSINDFDYLAEAFHESSRDSYHHVLINFGRTQNGDTILYTSGFHAEHLQKRLMQQAASLPKGSAGNGLAGRIRPSAGINYQRAKASEIKLGDEIADFAIIRF